jgi:hypothetical protein
MSITIVLIAIAAIPIFIIGAETLFLWKLELISFLAM